MVPLRGRDREEALARCFSLGGRNTNEHWASDLSLNSLPESSLSLSLFPLFLKTPTLSLSKKKKKKKKTLTHCLQGVRSDVKFIACEACEALARHAASHVAQLREEKKKEVDGDGGDGSPVSTPSRFKRPPPAKGTLTEAEILEAVEAMADPDAESGEWLAHFDLEVKNEKLKIKDMGERGKCGARCRTVAMAVADCLSGADTDLAERLWRGGSAAEAEEVAKWLCREETGVCTDSPPSLPAARAAALERELLAEPFAPESSEDAQLRQMMASMKQQGMGGQMFDRQSVLKSLKEEDEDEDDDDEEKEKTGGEENEKAAADARAKAALDRVIAEEEAKEKAAASSSSSSSAASPSSSSSSSDLLSEKAERAKAAAKDGLAAAKGWLSAKKASLFASSSSKSSKSTAEL